MEISNNDKVAMFHQPDSTWEMWQCYTHEDFMTRFMVEGKFHKNVPIEIVKDFEIVERLLCYAYYKYALLDEAFSKLTRIFEIAITLRLDQLGVVFKPDVRLIDKIELLTVHTSPDYLSKWNKARKVRNYFAHPKSGLLAGITIHRSFYQMVNVINYIFIDKSVLDENANHLNALIQKASHFRNEILVLEYKKKRYLICGAEPILASSSDDRVKYLWCFKPVLNSYPQTLDELIYTYPICIGLMNVDVGFDGMVGVNLQENEIVTLRKTNNPEDLAKFDSFAKMVKSADKDVNVVLQMHVESEMAHKQNLFEYEECWS